jgi:hypothetical protein
MRWETAQRPVIMDTRQSLPSYHNEWAYKLVRLKHCRLTSTAAHAIAKMTGANQ